MKKELVDLVGIEPTTFSASRDALMWIFSSGYALLWIGVISSSSRAGALQNVKKRLCDLTRLV